MPDQLSANSWCVVCGLTGSDPIPGDLTNRHCEVDYHDHPHWADENDADMAYYVGYAVGLGLVDRTQHLPDLITYNPEEYELGILDGEGDSGKHNQ